MEHVQVDPALHSTITRRPSWRLARIRCIEAYALRNRCVLQRGKHDSMTLELEIKVIDRLIEQLTQQSCWSSWIVDDVGTLLVRETDMKEFRVVDYRTSFVGTEIVIKSTDGHVDTIVERSTDVWVSVYETMGCVRHKYVVFCD